MDLKSFLTDLKKENISYISDEKTLLELEKNVTGYSRKILASVMPASTAEVQKLILLANEYKIPLYPVSQGKNIGLGSRLPVSEQAVLVSLEKMNKIIEVDEHFGVAIIEPGVTQRQLSQYLESKQSKYFIDVTGAPADTSVIGNILDKGVAYNTLRFRTVIDFQIVLGTGEILNTGYSHYKSTPLAHVSGYAPGPDMTGLFIQSNFGIVTSAAIKLNPKTEKHIAFTLSLNDPDRIGELIEKVKDLKQQKVIHGIAHIGNRLRSKISLAPMVYRYLQSIGQPVSRQKAEEILESFLPGSWSLVASVSGPAEIVKASKKVIVKELKEFGKISFLDENKFKLAGTLSKLLGMKKLNIYLNSISPLIGLTFGRPTDEALHSIYWPQADENPLWKDPDKARYGFIYIVPVVPLRKKEINQTLSVIKQIENQYDLLIAVTLNPLDAYVLEGVVSFDFKLDDEQDREKAHAAARKMIQEFVNIGIIPYRVDIENFDLIVDENDLYWQKIKELKRVFDPNNIIAPKKFNIV